MAPGTTPVSTSKPIVYDQVNYKLDRSINGRNEGAVSVQCKADWGINDSFSFQLQEDKGTYTATMTFDSETYNPLFNDGTLTIRFNPAAQTYAMSGVVDDRAWGFCDPKGALNLFIQSLECYANADDSKLDKNAQANLKSFATLVQQQASNIAAAAAPRFTGECVEKTRTRHDDYAGNTQGLWD